MSAIELARAVWFIAPSSGQWRRCRRVAAGRVRVGCWLSLCAPTPQLRGQVAHVYGQPESAGSPGGEGAVMERVGRADVVDRRRGWAAIAFDASAQGLFTGARIAVSATC